MTSTFRTAVYGPVRTVVWEGTGRATPGRPYPDSSRLETWGFSAVTRDTGCWPA